MALSRVSWVHRQVAPFSSRPALVRLSQHGHRFNSSQGTTQDLLSTIRTALKDSMRAKDQFRSGVLKSALGEIQTASYVPEGQEAPSPSKTLAKSLKKREEAIETFLGSGREDLAKTYQQELDILSQFVEKQTSRTAEEVEKLVQAAIDNLKLDRSDKQAMGKVIASVKQTVQDIDGKQLAATVKKLLTGGNNSSSS